MKKLFTILFLTGSLNSFAQTLITDTLYANGGALFAPPVPDAAGGSNTNIFKLTDNSILLCGYVYDLSVNGFYNVMLKADACGDKDTTFGINGYVQHTFDQRNAGYDYAIQPNGKIVVCGMQADGNGGSQQFPFVARYNADGNPDTTFGIMGTNKINYLGPQEFHSVYLMPDGKILCTNGTFAMRFQTDGTVDNTFGTNGVVTIPVPPGIAFFYNFTSVMRSDGKIVSTSRGCGGPDCYVTQLCYDTLGLVDSTFGTNGFYIDANLNLNGSQGPRLIIQNDDKVIAARGNNDLTITRYNTNGTVDTTFGVNGYINFPGVTTLEYISKFNDDKFLIGFPSIGSSQFYKYTADGMPDTNFSINGGNTFQFNNYERANIGLASASDEIIMGGFIGLSNGKFALTRFVLHSLIPQITQNALTLNANIQDTNSTFQWYLNGTAIANATDTTLTISQPGTYTVEVSNIWGCISSDAITVTNTGINIAAQLQGISFYPNPVSNALTIDNSSAKEITATLFDVSGKVLITQKIASGKNTISTNEISNGIYLLELKNEDGIMKTKIVKH